MPLRREGGATCALQHCRFFTRAMSIWQKEKQGKMAALAAGPAQPRAQPTREKYTVLKDTPVRKSTKPKADQSGTLRKGQVVFVDVRPFV